MFTLLRRNAILTEVVVPVAVQLKRMTMTADGKGAVFDVDSKAADEFMAKCGDTTSTDGHLITPTALPALKHKVCLLILLLAVLGVVYIAILPQIVQASVSK